MSYQIVTKSTLPQVVDLADWRARYASVKRGELGHPVVEIRSPARVLALTEAAIESSLRDYAKANGLTGAERAACIACALRWVRGGSSAAKAIGEGQKRARELAWGTVRTPTPDGAA
jgi:hypothetical protein